MMQWERKYWFSLIALVMYCNCLSAQMPDAERTTDTTIAPVNELSYVVGDIIITGNKRTRSQIILREVPFKAGETYPLSVIVRKFEDARRQ